MRKIFFSLSLLAVLGLSLSLLSKQSPSDEGAFWAWFASHQDELLKVQTGREEICSQLEAQLKHVNSSLVYEFGTEKNGRREFTISADGNSDAFPAVEALYAAAPSLPHWKIFKFRQRREPVAISISGISVEPDSVAVAVKKAGDRADVIIYIPDAPEDDRGVYGEIAFLMLDQAIGEYDVETRIGKVTVMPSSRLSGKTYSLKELPRVIDRMLKH
jgi:hypothetical protein